MGTLSNFGHLSGDLLAAPLLILTFCSSVRDIGDCDEVCDALLRAAQLLDKFENAGQNRLSPNLACMETTTHNGAALERDNRQSAVFCVFLWFSAVSCVFLRFSVKMVHFPGKGENQ